MFRKSQVAKLIKAADEHDQTAKNNGWRCNSDTERAMSTYRRARQNASEEEIAEFETLIGLR